MLCFRCGSPVSDAATTCDNCGQDLSSSAAPDGEKFAELQKKLRQSGREWRQPTASYDLGEVVAERYEINDVVGTGALGTVYKAFDQELEVDVALKVISGEYLPDEEARNHFLLTLQRVRDLSHDNVVRYLEVDHDGDRCYYVMRFLKGLPLRKIIDMRRAKGQRFSVAEVEPIFVQLCRALSDTGPILAHGGLKPENVIILPELLKITDFGLAESVPREAYLAAQRRYKDAIHYIAPEVVEKRDHDVRADIFSVGVILIELLTGKLRLAGEDVAVHALVDEVPPAVDEVLGRAVSHDPEQRQQTPEQLRQELAEALGVKGEVTASAPVEEEPPAPPEDADDDDTTARARLQPDDPDAPVQRVPRTQPDYSDPMVPPPQKPGSQVTHQLEVDDIEFASQSARTDQPPPGGLGLEEDDEDILGEPPVSAGDEVQEQTAKVDASRMEEQVAEVEDELRLASPAGPPPERTQQIDPDMIVDGEQEEESAEQVLLVPPGQADHFQVSGETRGELPEEGLEVADEPSFKPLSANLSDKVLSQDSVDKEARAREALQAFDFDTTLQEAVESAHHVEAPEPETSEVPLPKEEAVVEERPNVVTSETGRPVRGTLEVPVTMSAPPLEQDEGRTMVVAQEEVDRPPTTRLIPVLIVAFIVVLAAGTAGAIYYIGQKRSADAERERERKRAALALLMKKDAEPPAPKPDQGPAVAAVPLREDAAVEAEPDSGAPPPAAAAKQVPAPRSAPAKQARPPARPEKVAAAPRPRPEPPPARRPEPRQPAPPAPRASTGKCPGGLRHIPGRGGGEGYCIDRFEYPGRGRVPRVGGLAAAKAACRARGLRLCTAKEWIRACGGLFPYGRTYDPRRCNTGGGGLVTSGSKRRCRSRWGIYDMSGNVAEWVAEGVVMGGDSSAQQGHAGCMARGTGGGKTGIRCCSDTEWD